MYSTGCANPIMTIIRDGTVGLTKQGNEMNQKIETMADAVISMVEASVRNTSVTGGSCGSWCSDAHECTPQAEI